MVYVPDLHVSSFSQVKIRAEVFIASRKDSSHAGTFSLSASVNFVAASDYPVLDGLNMEIDLIQSLKCTVTGKTVEQVSSFGKYSTTVWFTGRCEVDPQGAKENTRGCRYWILACNNKDPRDARGTPDVVSFLIFNRDGQVLAHGTGPLKSGDVNIART